jgi:hypothetical protein
MKYPGRGKPRPYYWARQEAGRGKPRPDGRGKPLPYEAQG